MSETAASPARTDGLAAQPPLLEVKGLQKFFPITRGFLQRVVGHVRAVDGVDFTLAEGETGYSVFDVSAALREQGWLVPAYTFPADREDLAVLRVVVRNGFSHDLADLLIEALQRALPRLRSQQTPQRGAEAASFSHGADTRPHRADVRSAGS